MRWAELNRVEYGRPRVVRYASDASTPHRDPVDIREVLIPRFDYVKEDEMAELATEAMELSGKADRLEFEAVVEAETTAAALPGRHGTG